MKILAVRTVDSMVTMIKKARVAYGRGMPIMTDQEYDALEEALRRADPKNPVLQFSGSDVPTKMKVKLPFRMPSLTKRKHLTGEATQWLATHPGPYVVSWKADGVSGLRDYRKGRDKLYTRGRSGNDQGGDISFMLPEMSQLPDPTSDHVVRGELIMRNGVFDSKYAAENSNPRNMVGGITNRQALHPALEDVTFLTYELLVPRLKPSAALAKLKALGYDVVPHKVFQKLDEDLLLKLLKKARANTKYEVDGLVISQDKVTPLSSNDPDHTFAFKADSEDASAVTTVEELEWNETRTGFYFPRLRVKPVRLKGVTVTYASAKSAAFVRDNKLGAGAIIKLRRSGDVIPDVKDGDVLKPGVVKYPKNYEWVGANIRVPLGTGMSSDVRTMRLTHFFVTLGIERLKEATVALYVEAGYDTPGKILRMTESQFTKVEGVNRTSRIIYQSIQKLKTEGVDLATLMYASGLFGRSFGQRKCSAIIKAIPDIMKRVTMTTRALTQLIDDVPGFDVKQATAFALGLPKFVKFAEALKLPLRKTKGVKVQGTKLKGVSVLFTGFRNSELETLIMKNGGTMASGPASATVLLAKDVSGSSAKLAEARKRGVLVMTTQQFIKKYGL